MRKWLLMGMISLMLTTPALAQGFRFGDETKGLKVKISDDTDITMRIRLQPRFDMGDLVKSEDGNSYESKMDIYLRRIRLEFGGQLVQNLKYTLILEADKNGKMPSSGSSTNEIKIQYANLDYKFDDLFNVRFGKAKLPYSRVSLTSSSKQLIVERPVSPEAAKKLFDDYYQAPLVFSGKALEGLFGYNFAIGDGWEPNSTISTGTTVHKSSPLYIARVEVSPPGWTETSQSDAHLGKGKHLTFGANYATQKEIEYKTTAFEEDRLLTGLDVSGHWEGFTGQFEYNAFKVESTDTTKNNEPKGWYIQG